MVTVLQNKPSRPHKFSWVKTHAHQQHVFALTVVHPALHADYALRLVVGVDQCSKESSATMKRLMQNIRIDSSKSPFIILSYPDVSELLHSEVRTIERKRYSRAMLTATLTKQDCVYGDRVGDAVDDEAGPSMNRVLRSFHDIVFENKRIAYLLKAEVAEVDLNFPAPGDLNHRQELRNEIERLLQFGNLLCRDVDWQFSSESQRFDVSHA
jgi:hypothetical protein